MIIFGDMKGDALGLFDHFLCMAIADPSSVHLCSPSSGNAFLHNSHDSAGAASRCVAPKTNGCCLMMRCRRTPLQLSTKTKASAEDMSVALLMDLWEAVFSFETMRMADPIFLSHLEWTKSRVAQTTVAVTAEELKRQFPVLYTKRDMAKLLRGWAYKYHKMSIDMYKMADDLDK